MATVRDVVTRALRRIRVTGAIETPEAEDAETALDALNGMLERWPALGVDAKYAPLTLDDVFAFFVPPADAEGEVIDALALQGAWDAALNVPALASGTGTFGHYYRVATAGATTLDGVSAWAVGDYAVFEGRAWLKSIHSDRFRRGVTDMLALDLCPDYGKEPDALLVRAAADAWSQIQAAYIKSPTATLDRQIMQTMQRSVTETEIVQ